MGKREDFDQKLLRRLKKEASEQAGLPTQNLGRLTTTFKSFSPFLKYSPWRVFAPLSFIFTLFLFLLLGRAVIRIASILQRGF